MFGALNVAELALFGKGFRSAPLRRAGHLEHPKCLYFFFKLLQFFVIFCFVCKEWPATHPVSNRLLLFLSHPLSSCSCTSSTSRSRNRDTTAAAGAIYSSSSSTHLPSTISLGAATRVQRGVYHAPKWALFSRLVCRVGREYK